MNRKYFYYLVPLAGTAFCLWYIFAATCDGIYSDYVRLVNSYLPDVFNPAKFFVPDVLTRIPVNYLGRIINTALFQYNIMFDRVLGVVALGLSGAVLASYCIRKKLSFLWAVILGIVLFSLNKWEMLTNGSGWAHFLAFACFYYHYHLLDRVWSKEEKRFDKEKLMLLPFVTTLMVAGPYCAVYSAVVILSCGFMAWQKRSRDSVIYGVCTLVPFLLYLWSNSYAIEDHAVPADISLIDQLKETPGFFVRFFLKSFSSMVIGGERAEELFKSNAPFLAMGLLVILAYLIALILNWRYRLYKETSLPLMFLLSGGANHVLILLSRWIFLKENYGLSSRYALQFQMGILGILLTLALVLKKQQGSRRRAVKWLAVSVSCLFVIGNTYTTWIEIEKAPFRKSIYEQRASLALDFENCTDLELKDGDGQRPGFEYRTSREDSGAKVRSALRILKENGYSVFRNQDR